jgi:uncharacterized membrane protein
MQTLTRVYDTYSHATNVVEALEKAAIPASDISLVANKYVSEKYANVDDASSAATGAGVGAVAGGGLGLLTGLGIMAIPGLGPVVAVGWLATTLLGTAAGAATGGLIGTLAGHGVSEDDAHVYAETVRRGGTMVTVRAADELAATARSIMDRFSPINPATRRTEYARSGWSKFDPAAEPYTPSQADLERMRRL